MPARTALGPEKVRRRSCPLRTSGSRQDARGYILTPNPDFAMVCHLAGLDPEAVRRGFRARLAEADTSAAQAPRQVARTHHDPGPTPSRTYSYGGQALTLREWAERAGLTYELLQTRVGRRSWPIERALTEPVGRRMPKPSRSEPKQVAHILERLAAAKPLAGAAIEAGHPGARPTS
ncbi:hypothetical protein [Rubellimicrobium mesophilum]|uniref:hypothetical protein n=1 Tax=Rubellimicrobium mesophilum TaxID=1123067 RepID=UPI0006EB7E69|nr:hypothetical protein [Rubellimicrobium mesophilum]